jgi:hypothetical protein
MLNGGRSILSLEDRPEQERLQTTSSQPRAERRYAPPQDTYVLANSNQNSASSSHPRYGPGEARDGWSIGASPRVVWVVLLRPAGEEKEEQDESDRPRPDSP